MKGFDKLRGLNRWASFGKPRQRSLTTTSVKRGGDHHHDEGGIPGTNFPFQTKNRWRLAATMGAYLASGFATPFLLMRFHLKKKSGA